MVVGHLHPVAQYRVGDGEGGVPDFGSACLFQIGFGGIDDGVVVFARQDLGFFNLLRGGFEREAGVGAADVGNQARPEAV